MKYQTLRRIARDNGFPFKAKSEAGIDFTCTGISPTGEAVGWTGVDCINRGWNADQFAWTFVEPKTVLKEHLYSCMGTVHCGWFTDEEFSTIDGNLIKILREIEVESE